MEATMPTRHSYQALIDAKLAASIDLKTAESAIKEYYASTADDDREIRVSVEIKGTPAVHK